MQSPLISHDFQSNQYIKWLELFEHFSDNYILDNKIYWDYLNKSGRCIDFVDQKNCGDHSEQHPLRFGYSYRTVHKYTRFNDFELIGHGGDRIFRNDFKFALEETLDGITKSWPHWHYNVKLITYFPEKKSVKFKYDKSSFDANDVHRLLLDEDMLFALIANDRMKLLVEVDIDHSSADCSCIQQIM